MKHSKRPATPRFLVIVSFLALGGLFLAACSGGGGSAGGQSTPAAQATQAQVKTPAASTPPASGKTPAPSSSTSLDVCSLLTKQEVETATGTQVLDPKPEGTGAMVSCNYNDPKFPDYNVVSLNILIGSDASDAKSTFEMGKGSSGGAPAVDGLGDGAFWIEPTGDLEVLKGKYDISVWIFVDSDDRLGIAKALATKVVGRLS